jgi:hypothetical protein
MDRPTKWLASLVALSFASAPHAQQPIDLPGDRLFPESVSITSDGMAYISSMHGGDLRVSLSTGAVEQWISPVLRLMPVSTH